MGREKEGVPTDRLDVKMCGMACLFAKTPTLDPLVLSPVNHHLVAPGLLNRVMPFDASCQGPLYRHLGDSSF